ncbi:MAG: cupin domain-containing protein [Betaproteobacteria bacterium]|nr:cupin domain-containing protein [Betaproteobacteria bacterium]
MQTVQEAGKTLFAAFEQGELALSGRRVKFMERDWQPHSQFAGVALKHLLTAADTGGAFSYHLVRVEPGCAIGEHVHATQQETHEVVAGDGVCRIRNEGIDYRAGLISLIEPGVRHTVTASEKGLLMFAKFIPPLL